jgi:hypothetical protein
MTAAAAKDKKKLMFLGGLGVLLAIVMYVNLFSGPSVPAPDHAAVAPKSAPGRPLINVGDAPAKSSGRARGTTRGSAKEFHPIWWPNRPEDQPDLNNIDPTLLLDRFTKVQDVDAAGGKRNLFAFGQPPPPPASLAKGPETHVPLNQGAEGPVTPPGPVTPTDLPVRSNLKYYGIVALSAGGKKTACFLDTGEEVLLATEGETLKRRFKVTKIGTASVTLQDTESKREETIPLAAEAKDARGS